MPLPGEEGNTEAGAVLFPQSHQSFEESKTSSQMRQQAGHMCPTSVATALQELREEPRPSGPLAHREKSTGLLSTAAEGILGTKQGNQLPLPPALQAGIPKSRCQDGSVHSVHSASFQFLGNQCHSSLCFCLDVASLSAVSGSFLPLGPPQSWDYPIHMTSCSLGHVCIDHFQTKSHR